MFFRRKKRKGVVLVRLDAIGDFVVWTHTAAEYSRHYEKENIVLIANALWADLAAQLPYWDEVWPVDVERFNKKLLYRWRMIWKVNRAGFRVAIQPTYSRIMLKGDSIIRATNAVHRIGSQGDLSNMTIKRKAIADSWFTQLIPASPHPLTELEKNVDFVNTLFQTSLPLRLQTFPVLKSQQQPWQNTIQKTYVILFPGASKELRQWPTKHFSEVADVLHRQFGWQILVCGSAGEWDLCQNVCDQIKSEVINLAGKTSLPSFFELVRGAKLLISNETSAVHIAAAVHTPAICVTGGGHYGRFVPYPPDLKKVLLFTAQHEMPCFHCNWNCSHPSYKKDRPAPCIEKITTKDVLNLVAFITKETIGIESETLQR